MTPEEMAREAILSSHIDHFSDGDYNSTEVLRAATIAARLALKTARNEALEEAAKVALSFGQSTICNKEYRHELFCDLPYGHTGECETLGTLGALARAIRSLKEKS